MGTIIYMVITLPFLYAASFYSIKKFKIHEQKSWKIAFFKNTAIILIFTLIDVLLYRLIMKP